jgi:hypothetical protein
MGGWYVAGEFKPTVNTRKQATAAQSGGFSF